MALATCTKYLPQYEDEHQKSLSKKVLFLLIFLHMFSGMLQNSIKVYSPSIEQQFGLSSADVGYTLAANDAGHLVSLLPSALLAFRVGRPRLFMLGGITMSIGGFLLSGGHFLCEGKVFDVGDVANVTLHTEHFLCKDHASAKDTHSENRTRPILQETEKKSICNHKTLAYITAFMSFLIGLGGGPITILHLSFVEDNSSSSKSPLLGGLIQCASVLGILLAYILASIITKSSSGEVHGGDDNWWKGFLIASCGTLVASTLAGCIKDQATGEDGYHQISENCSEDPNNSVFESKPKEDYDVDGCSSRSILTNPVIICTLLSIMCVNFEPILNTTFTLKYMVQGLGLPLSSASLIIGFSTWLPAIIGIPLGGFIVSKLEMSTSQISKMLVCLIVLAAISYPIACPEEVILGIHTTNNPASKCEMDCNCANDLLMPICGNDLMTYASPCHAGCTDEEPLSSGIVYRNCTCLLGHASGSSAIQGHCDSCTKFVRNAFILNLVLRNLALCLSFIPFGIFLMRVVAPQDKSLIVAIKESTGKLLGSIPGSIVVGKAFDMSCFYQLPNSGCRLYNKTKLKQTYFLLNFIPGLIAITAIASGATFLRKKNKT